ncbi:MAG TPA: GNAT family N-acetyltransferase [Caulobacteraceae bacterium]|jgi:predicted GNAT family N-acyltransferase|nr:GNAT family N-acetyltransferase [Caulobacteraceae bacterium]
MNARVDPKMSGQPVAGVLPPRFETTVARTMEDLMQVMMVRSLVYIGEQKCPYEEEYDGNDFSGATHLILRRNKEPIGTLRIRWFADFAKLERVAVRSEYRGTRATLELVREAFRIAERKGYTKILGHAQARLVPFWARHFKFKQLKSEGFHFSDHEYVEMVIDITPPANALTIHSDPMVLVRPEGEWDKPGVLDWSSDRPATNPLAHS